MNETLIRQEFVEMYDRPCPEEAGHEKEKQITEHNFTIFPKKSQQFTDINEKRYKKINTVYVLKGLDINKRNPIYKLLDFKLNVLFLVYTIQ